MTVTSPQIRLRNFGIAGALLLSLGTNVAFFGYWHLRDDERIAISAKLGIREHQSGPTIVIGDSIIAPTIGREGPAINLAVAGATIDWIAEHQLDTVAKLQPSRIILAAGVNDLRAGGSPWETAAKLLALAESLGAIGRQVEVIVLAILPPARAGELAGSTSVSSVFETNRLLIEQAAVRGLTVIDHSLLFASADGLQDHLTYDGLHLNAAGQALLENLLYRGLASSPTEYKN